MRGSALRVAGVALVTCVVVNAVGASPATKSWTDVTRLPSELLLFESDGVMDDDGNSVIVWRTDGSIEAAFREAGRRWKRQSIDTGAQQTAADPAIGVDASGNAVVAWAERATNELLSIRTARRPRGGVFGAPETIDTFRGARVHNLALAVSRRGDTVLAWTRRINPNGGSYRVEASVSRPGDGFTRGQLVGTTPPAPLGVGVDIDRRGNALVVWTSEKSEIDTALARPGTRFASGTIPGARGWRPQVAFDEAGTATAVWWGESRRNVMSTSRPRGRPWTAPTIVGDAFAAPGPPQLVVEADGTAHAGWRDDTSFLVASRTADGDWQPLVTVGTDLGPGDIALVGNASGTLVATWATEVGRGPADIRAAVARNASWGPAETVAGARATGVGLSAAVDAAGNGLVVWPQCPSYPCEALELAGRDGSGPRLEDVRVPRRGTRGVSVLMSVVPHDVWSRVTSTTWAFGDGSRARGTSASHRYTKAGRYTVTVASTDARGYTTTAVRRVRVSL